MAEIYSFRRESSGNILNNSYVVLNSVFIKERQDGNPTDKGTDFDRSTLEQSVENLVNDMNNYREQILETKLSKLRDDSFNIEKNFFQDVLGVPDNELPKEPLECAKKFTDYLNFKKFITKNEDGSLSTIINSASFEKMMDKGLEEIATANFSKEEFQDESTKMLERSIKKQLGEEASDFFSNLNLEDGQIRKGIEKIWGARYLKQKLREAQKATKNNNKITPFHKTFNKSDPNKETMAQAAIEGALSGQLTEWAKSSDIKSSAGITVSFEDTGQKMREHNRMFYENGIVVENKEERRNRQLKNFGVDPFSKSFKVAQKTDSRIIFTVIKGEDIFEYKLNISNKFRSTNKNIDLQSSGVVNNQIMQIKEILGNGNNVDKLLKNLMFITLNNAPGAFLEGEGYTEIINNFLQMVGIVYMFDDITEINDSNIFLFQMNQGVLCASAILDSILNVAKDPKLSFIKTKVKHNSNAENLYNENKKKGYFKDLKLQDREKNLRSLLSSEKGSASEYIANFNTNLMVSQLVL